MSYLVLPKENDGFNEEVVITSSLPLRQQQFKQCFAERPAKAPHEGSDMGVIQVSVFVENQPGRVKRLTDILEKAGVSIRGFSLADTADFGIARFVLNKPEEAIEAFIAAGALIKTTELLCVELLDEPGALGHVFEAVASANINVEYSYSLVSTYAVLKVNDIQQAQTLLAKHPVRFIEQDDLRSMPVPSAPALQDKTPSVL
jgi:hypothetical protein